MGFVYGRAWNLDGVYINYLQSHVCPDSMTSFYATGSGSPARNVTQSTYQSNRHVTLRYVTFRATFK